MIFATLNRLNQRLEAAVHGRFFRDLGIVSCVRLTGGFLLFVSQIFLARWMSTEAFGIYSFAWTWVAVLGSLAGLGLAATSVRFLASYNALGDHERMRGLVRYAWRSTMTVSALIAAISWVCFELAIPNSPYLPGLRIAMLAVPVMAALNIDAAFARGMQWMGISAVAEQVGRPALLLLIGAVLVELFDIRSPIAFVAACLFAYFSVTLVQHVVVHRRLQLALGPGLHQIDIGKWRQVSTMLLLLNGAQMLRMNGDPILVGALLGPSEVALYTAAVRTATLVSFVLTITSVVAQPNLSAVHARNDRRAMTEFFGTARRWSFVATLASGTLLCVLGKLILAQFGQYYVDAYPALLILVAGHVIAAAFGPLTSLLIMSDRQRTATVILGAATILNALLTYALAKPWGISGAAFASGFSLIFAQVALMIACNTRNTVTPH